MVGPFVPAVLVAAFVAQLSSGAVMLQRVKADTSVSVEKVRPGEPITLSVQVTPDRKIRVFAPGSKDYTPVFIAIGPNRDFSFGKPKYPIPSRESVPGTKKKVLLYKDKFTLAQTITIDPKAARGRMLRITGTLHYQACDDRSVFAQSAMPVSWTVEIQ